MTPWQLYRSFTRRETAWVLLGLSGRRLSRGPPTCQPGQLLTGRLASFGQLILGIRRPSPG